MLRRSKRIIRNELDNRIEESDEQLVQCFQTGQREVFGLLYSRYGRAAYYTAYKILGNDADARDAVQASFANAFTGLELFRGEASFKTWLLRIVSNAAWTIKQKKSRQRDVEARFAADRPTEDNREPESVLTDNEKWTLIAKILQQHATARMWQVCVLYFEEGLSLRKTAAKLRTTVWQVRKDMHKLRTTIRQHLDGRGWSLD